ncbi:Gcv operon activator [Leclercia adecarboxylata]|uniref:Gcv operon activator n=1 Tax=Leclercia adecarboxylata TaxID=83655 RepID=A0A4U9HVK6_9ENTR|nr:Gcv operon activator [Leclercia adecarboxylata]
MSRRSFPLTAVEAFIVTARHLNLTHAAKELCLTQGAVSRKIAALEIWFGFPLFERHARGLRLSSQGSALLPDLRASYEHFLTVADQARAQQTVVRLKVPTCAMRWLVPRLLQVEREQPELQIALTTTNEHSVNFKTESYDAAIVFGTQLSAGDLLFEEALTPVVSPLRQGSAVESLTFLHPTRDKNGLVAVAGKTDRAAACHAQKSTLRHHGSGDHRCHSGAGRRHRRRDAGGRRYPRRAAGAALCHQREDRAPATGWCCGESRGKAAGLAAFRECLLNPG